MRFHLVIQLLPFRKVKHNYTGIIFYKMINMQTTISENGTQKYAHYFPIIIRLVTGWLYFSALWRRTVLMHKLDPNGVGYIGEKFNTFLPNALGIKPVIQFMIDHPDILWISMVVFSIIEGIVGLMLISGFLTRLGGIGALGLAFGILLGAGWLGTTCLDEWQIGVFGLITGAYLALSGGGQWSVDNWLINRNAAVTRKKWFQFVGGRDLADILPARKIKPIVLGIALSLAFIALATNQIFHGGVWGKLHNLSKNPKLELTAVKRLPQAISFDAMRVQGIDTYGSFVVEVRLVNPDGNVVQTWDEQSLSKLDKAMIINHHILKIKTAPHGLVFPLGAKATIALPLNNGIIIPDGSKLVLEDVSGVKWNAPIKQ